MLLSLYLTLYKMAHKKVQHACHIYVARKIGQFLETVCFDHCRVRYVVLNIQTWPRSVQISILQVSKIIVFKLSQSKCQCSTLYSLDVKSNVFLSHSQYFAWPGGQKFQNFISSVRPPPNYFLLSLSSLSKSFCLLMFILARFLCCQMRVFCWIL